MPARPNLQPNSLYMFMPATPDQALFRDPAGLVRFLPWRAMVATLRLPTSRMDLTHTSHVTALVWSTCSVCRCPSMCTTAPCPRPFGDPSDQSPFMSRCFSSRHRRRRSLPWNGACKPLVFVPSLVKRPAWRILSLYALSFSLCLPILPCSTTPSCHVVRGGLGI